MKQYIKNRWARLLQLFKPAPASNIPYYVVRSHVEAGFERRYIIIDALLTVAILLPIGFAIDSTLRSWPWWQIIVVGMIVYVMLSFISAALNLTADAMTIVDEDHRVHDCVEFIRQQQYSREILEDIADLAALNSGATQNKLSLPAIILTAVATVAVIGIGSIGLGFTLGMLALLSLLSFATTTGEANADLIVQKAVLLVSREEARTRKEDEKRLLWDMVMSQTSTPGTTRTQSSADGKQVVR